jgi:DNA-binding NarL/FixJ family response regulator
LGVRGWVGKQCAIASLLTAVRGAARGEIHLPAPILTRVLASLSERDRLHEPEAEAIAILTARELEVLQGLTEGLSRNQLGTLLDVSTNTVRSHIQSILRKLDVHSALAAAALARRAGVVGLQDSTVTPI